jgi:hypothetical protein
MHHSEDKVMSELYRGQVLALFGHVGLCDAGDKNSCPQWLGGNAGCVFGPKGVAVAAAVDRMIEIIINPEDLPQGAIFYRTGIIEVGKSGVVVGNILACMTAQIPWSPGKTRIDIYANDIVGSATQIIFVLGDLEIEWGNP